MERLNPGPQPANGSLAGPVDANCGAGEGLFDLLDSDARGDENSDEKTRVLDADEMSTPTPSPPKSQTPSSPGTDPVFKDYKLLKKLGEGAMGSVYRAFQISASREVALKVILP